MKKVFLLLIFCLILTACTFRENKDDNLNLEKYYSDPYYCEKDSDCEITYGVLYNDECRAGCFNIDLISDRCHDVVWEPFSPDTNCNCIDNKCEVIYK